MAENDGTVTAPQTVEEAEAAALARTTVPPGMTVVDPPPAGGYQPPVEGPGARMAREAATAAKDLAEGELIAANEPVRDAMKRLADDKPTDDDMALGLEWLLSDQQEVNTRELKVRAGGSDANPIYLSWIIRAANTDEIRQAERAGEGNRAQRRAGEPVETDQVRANCRLIATATMSVNDKPLHELSSAKGISDPAVWLQQRFHYRAGLIPALAGQVMDLSGFAQDDVRAVGNS